MKETKFRLPNCPLSVRASGKAATAFGIDNQARSAVFWAPCGHEQDNLATVTPSSTRKGHFRATTELKAEVTRLLTNTEVG